jgi:hypothetical protein
MTPVHLTLSTCPDALPPQAPHQSCRQVPVVTCKELPHQKCTKGPHEVCDQVSFVCSPWTVSP